MGQFRDRWTRGWWALLVKRVRRDFYILIRGHNNVYKTINILRNTHTHIHTYARVCVSYLRKIKPSVAHHNDLCGFILIFQSHSAGRPPPPPLYFSVCKRFSSAQSSLSTNAEAGNRVGKGERKRKKTQKNIQTLFMRRPSLTHNNIILSHSLTLSLTLFLLVESRKRRRSLPLSTIK